MKEYNFKINGNDYNVGIDNVRDGKASVTVNGEAFEVDLSGDISLRENAGDRLPKGQSPRVESPVPGNATDRKVVSPLPGVIVEICVKEGDPVRQGQKVAVLEAMKMENEIQAEFSGTVSAIFAKVSDSVLEGDAILSIKG